MRALTAFALAASLWVGGCNKAEEASTPQANIAPTAESEPPQPPIPNAHISPRNAQTKDAEQPPVGPQMAYSYEYGFRIPARQIAPLEQRHADLCESKGPNVCRIISLKQTGAEGAYEAGSLELAVAADKARAFGKELTEVANAANGEQVSASISGEDLSKEIIDTEARLRARILLRDRLMEVLATRKGTVAELVEAERGVAQVNEEIDKAQSWLAEMRGRVDFSHITIEYESGMRNGGGFIGPIREALGSVGAIVGTILGALIAIAAGVLPLAALVLLGIWARKWIRKLKNNQTNESGLPEGE